MKLQRFLIILFVVFFPVLLGADETTLRMESHVIETWDGEEASFFSDTGEPIYWEVRGSKFSLEGKPRKAYAMEEWPIDLLGPFPEGNREELGVLGINGAFVRQGYNQIELIPGTGSGDAFVAKAVPFPGRVQTVDFWVWGSNYNFYVELHFRDFQGIAHVLSPIRLEQKREMGSIKFVGWKNMFLDIPNYIKQFVNYKPSLANLSLTKIVFITHPSEIVNDFYIYVDHFKVLSDFHESYYDGIELATKERLKETWGEGE